jgi:folate-dependent phosphoribosylglycinamide formyltransferase PurN
MITGKKIVIITNGNYFARLILDDLLDKYASAVAGVLIVTGDYKARTGANALWTLSRVTAFPYLVYKILVLLAFAAAKHFCRRGIFTAGSLAAAHDIPVHSVVSVNSPEATEWVTRWDPHLLVSVSCPQMISGRVLSLAKIGGINIHSSLLPAYAGLAPYFWVLSCGERMTGTTVHYMTAKFDEGNILSQQALAIQPAESAFRLFHRLAMTGSRCLLEATELALDNAVGQPQTLNTRSYFSHPTIASYRALRRNHHVLVRVKELCEVISQEARRIAKDKVDR